MLQIPYIILNVFPEIVVRTINITLEIMQNCNALTFSIRVLQYNPIVK